MKLLTIVEITQKDTINVEYLQITSFIEFVSCRLFSKCIFQVVLHERHSGAIKKRISKYSLQNTTQLFPVIILQNLY